MKTTHKFSLEEVADVLVDHLSGQGMLPSDGVPAGTVVQISVEPESSNSRGSVTLHVYGNVKP